MIVYRWNRRKAARNLRQHFVSFSLAEKPLKSGSAVPVEEQYRGGEWRTKIVALAGAVLLLTILVGTGDEDESSDEYEEGGSTEEDDGTERRVLRIISARKAGEEERALFFEAQPGGWE